MYNVLRIGSEHESEQTSQSVKDQSNGAAAKDDDRSLIRIYRIMYLILLYVQLVTTVKINFSHSELYVSK